MWLHSYILKQQVFVMGLAIHQIACVEEWTITIPNSSLRQLLCGIAASQLHDSLSGN